MGLMESVKNWIQPPRDLNTLYISIDEIPRPRDWGIVELSVGINVLISRMVELSGLTVKDNAQPEGDIELKITSLRPGEKLYEELLIGDNPKPTQHPRIMKAHEQFLPWAQLAQKLDALSAAIGVNDVPVIRAMLQELVSGYQPSGDVVDWIHLAHEQQAQTNG